MLKMWLCGFVEGMLNFPKKLSVRYAIAAHGYSMPGLLVAHDCRCNYASLGQIGVVWTPARKGSWIWGLGSPS